VVDRIARKTRALALGATLFVACRPAVHAAPPLEPTTAAPDPVAKSLPAPSTARAPSAPFAEPAPYKAYDINHVLSTGQSLAIGVSGAPPTTLTQPFHNLMFNTGVMAGGEELTSFEPLVEGDNIPGSKVHVETMSASFANLVAELALASGQSHDILLSNHASGAKSYWQLKKGTKYYANGMAQVAAGAALAKQQGKTYVVRAVTTVHGESDHADRSTRYAQDLLEWQTDYERDVQAITGQTEAVPMFESQISSWTRMMGGTETSGIPAAQLEAHVKSRAKDGALAALGGIFLVGPKYHLPYSSDGVHLSMEGYRHMGEDYAKAYKRVVIDRQPWEPLRPIAVTREGAVITIKLVVPAPPIVLDTTLVTDPGHFGFEYFDAAGTSTPAITAVEIAGPDTVRITLEREPTAENRRVRYAYTAARHSKAGPTSGPRGNLRDSDPTKSRTGKRLYNWCIHFDEAVP
jgi:hypothetical protein